MRNRMDMKILKFLDEKRESEFFKLIDLIRFCITIFLKFLLY